MFSRSHEMDSEDFVLRGKVPYPFAEMSALGRAV